MIEKLFFRMPPETLLNLEDSLDSLNSHLIHKFCKDPILQKSSFAIAIPIHEVMDYN